MPDQVFSEDKSKVFLMARKVYVIGNWKMYKTARESTDYIEHLLPLIEGCEQNIYLAVPYTSIASASAFAKKTCLVIGAQNMNDAREGAFTGEIAALMLKEAGASFVILGHSERRERFGETDEMIHRKVVRALQDDIQPILCVGETVEERNSGKTEEALQRQIASALDGIPKEDVSRLILAYEPVWAIGTGLSATEKLIEDAHAHCRAVFAELFGKRAANAISIVYGGSVKAENAAKIAAQKNVDGVLVGGSSLDYRTFASIALACRKPKKTEKES